MPKQHPKSPKSVIGKVCAILEQFEFDKPVLSLEELYQGSGIPRTTTYRILQNLIEEGYIALNREGYQLGLRAFRLGMIAKENFTFGEMVDDILAPFAKEIEETFLIGALYREEIIYLHVIEPPKSLRFVVRAGERRHACFGATGLALLSCLDETVWHSYARQPLPRYTPNTITEPNAWLERLRQVAQKGIALERGEYIEGVQAIAVPIKSPTPLVLTIVGPEERMMPKEKMIICKIKEIAKQLEKVPLPKL